MNTKIITITGSPGSGKTSIIKELTKQGFVCFDEVSREIILKARKNGIEQLFLTKPIKFSELVLDGRIKQFNDASNSNNKFVFLDRGIPDIPAYMDFKKNTYPNLFNKACETYKYNAVFILAPWQEIFTNDNERYENFNQAISIHKQLVKTYTKYNYDLIEVPFGCVEERANYIINVANAL